MGSAQVAAAASFMLGALNATAMSVTTTKQTMLSDLDHKCTFDNCKICRYGSDKEVPLSCYQCEGGFKLDHYVNPTGPPVCVSMN